jgi:hypothetical protein
MTGIDRKIGNLECFTIGLRTSRHEAESYEPEAQACEFSYEPEAQASEFPESMRSLALRARIKQVRGIVPNCPDSG